LEFAGKAAISYVGVAGRRHLDRHAGICSTQRHQNHLQGDNGVQAAAAAVAAKEVSKKGNPGG
jgi:hypothetical protein